jgi:hypothetical protein
MAKNLFKKAKSAVKRSTNTHGETSQPGASSAKSSAKLHIESLSKKRRDAAVMWGMIEKGNHSDAEIKEICKEKGFTQLLSEI